MVRAIEERRAVCISGAARCGLSRWTADFVAERFGGSVDAIDGSSLDDSVEVASALRLNGADGVLMSPKVARQTHRQSDNNSVIWISNFQSASRAAQELVARYLFAGDGISSSHRAVLVEGAVDIGDLVASVFPEGVNSGPFVAIAEDGYPWRSLAEIAELAKEVAPAIPPLVIPWVVDLTGGDLVLAREAINTLRGLGSDEVDSSALAGTWLYVAERSSIARLMRRAVDSIDCGRILDHLLAGQTIPGSHITRCEDLVLRRLFFAGCISFDRSSGGYRLRGPLTAWILLSKRGNVDGPRPAGSYDRATIGARTAVVLLELAQLELQLRSTLYRTDWEGHAKSVSTPAQWSGASKKAIAVVNANSQLPPDLKGALCKELREALPDQVPALQVAQERASRAGAAGTDLLDYLGLAEIFAVAARVGVLDGDIRFRLDSALVGVRNALAHFRGLDYDAASAAVKLAGQVCRSLVEKQSPHKD